jgi:thioredoxin-like negative regulator of GroEL
MAGTVISVSDENYEELKQAPAAMVAYGIGSCQPCGEYDPILESVAAKYEHIQIGKAKMHVPGRCRGIKKQHTFETYPTTHFFSNGQLLLTREGKIEESELATLFQKHFPNQ